MSKQQTQEVQFQAPFDVIPLPSKGLLYPGQQGNVKVEYMTAMDENILTSPNLIKSGKVLDILLERKVKESFSEDNYLNIYYNIFDNILSNSKILVINQHLLF